MTLETDRSTHSSDNPATTAQSEDVPKLSSDEIFHILQTNRRRDTIRYLLDTDGPVKMRDIAEYVAARENDKTVEELTSAERQRVYIPLYQSHLPKLDDEGIIEYNQPRGIVRPTDRLQIFKPYIEATDNGSAELAYESTASRTDTEYYVTAVGASLSLLFASAAGFLSIPGLLLGAIVTALFVLVTLVATFPQIGKSTDGITPR